MQPIGAAAAGPEPEGGAAGAEGEATEMGLRATKEMPCRQIRQRLIISLVPFVLLRCGGRGRS